MKTVLGSEMETSDDYDESRVLCVGDEDAHRTRGDRKRRRRKERSSSSSLVSQMFQFSGFPWNTTTKRDVLDNHSQQRDSYLLKFMMRVKRRSSDHCHFHDNNPRTEAEFAKISRIFENYENQEFDESWRVAGYPSSSSSSSLAGL